MLKILEVIPTLSVTGGAETFFVNLSCAIKKSGYDSNHLKAICLYQDKNAKLSEKLRNNGVDVTFFNKKTGIDFLAAREVRKFICKYRPDVIHTHSLSLTTLFLALGLFHPKIKIFHTFHSIASNECPKRSQMLLYKFLIKMKWCIPMGISKNVSLTISEVFKCKTPFYINNGAPIDEFKNNIKLSERHVDFIHIGRFEDVKNHPFLLSSFKKVLQVYPKALLQCIGTGTRYDETVALAHSLQLDKNVSFLGLRSDINELLSDSIVFVLPSKYEGNPISIIEAMAAGLPIIASRVGGIPDIVSDQRNGYLFEVGDETGFVEKMIYACSHPEELEKMRLANIEDSSQYSIETCAKEYLAYFPTKI